LEHGTHAVADSGDERARKGKDHRHATLWPVRDVSASVAPEVAISRVFRMDSLSGTRSSPATADAPPPGCTMPPGFCDAHHIWYWSLG